MSSAFGYGNGVIMRSCKARSRQRQEANVGTASSALAPDDIEDLGVEWLSPLDRFRAHRTLSVTDLSAQAWCEQQLALGLQHGRQRTQAMQKGIERHEALELELHDIVNIDVSSPCMRPTPTYMEDR